MMLFQYWDAPPPPEDVAGWMEELRTRNPELDYQLFDRERALRWLGETYGDAEADDFSACAVPAMQADYLRLFLIEHYGGFYLDVDNRHVAPLTEMIAAAGNGVLLLWLDLLGNDFLLFREPGHPFIRACRALMVDNIRHRRFESVTLTGGPAVLNAVRYIIDLDSRPVLDFLANSEHRCFGAEWPALLRAAEALIEPADELVSAYRALDILPVEWKRPWVAGMSSPYKEGERYWQNWRGSIYR